MAASWIQCSNSLHALACAYVFATALSCRSSQQSSTHSQPIPPEPSTILSGFGGDAVDLVIETEVGSIPCQVYHRRTPRAAALFVGLARGGVRWVDPVSATLTDRALYQNLTFFRAIEGVMVQSGCPLNNGTGHPGYRIPVESHSDDAQLLSQPGSLILARYMPPPNRVDPDPPPPGHVLGSQFAILLTDMHHLAGTVSVLGRCDNLSTVARIAETVAKEHRKPRLERVRVLAR